nr:MAG TPA: hypothetical protein [Caudoviricetes sp.]
MQNRAKRVNAFQYGIGRKFNRSVRGFTSETIQATRLQTYLYHSSYCTNKGLKEKVISGFVLHCTDASRERALQEEQRKEQDTWKLQTR